MDVRDLQRRLHALGCYAGAIDGSFGPASKAGLKAALTGPRDRLAPEQIAAVAASLDLTPAHVGAVYDVESRGNGMASDGLPIILFERHWFARLTSGKHNAYSAISNSKPGGYPKTQAERWDQMLRAVALDPNAALQSASWGLFQIMGFNHAAVGQSTPWAFAREMAAGEGAHLQAFAAFIKSKGLVDELRDKRWAAFARAYNGPNYAINAYDTKLAAAYAARGGR
ncbi:N-acetylmuramidase domain-containing protein [Brevundimonas sp. TWP2-3-4b1]|uniref:N-acetylmuramidase domain-containing protein n=1 Tax=Brevundimonas sp. TWP2-3-4b1 TaxID=2804580 RepID=UPI003CF2ED87